MVSVLNITSHLGGGLGTMIGAYLAQSELDHTILELSKTENPTFIGTDVDIITLERIDKLRNHISNHDILLVHYYCHPLISWALHEMNCAPAAKIVAWCHNNGLNALHPLPDRLNAFADSVVLSGCKDKRFTYCDVIRPVPNIGQLELARSELSRRPRDCSIEFRYIGSLDSGKIHKCANEWFGYLNANWTFEISTLDAQHEFKGYKIRVGETNRCALYNQYFCVVYPLRKDHYGCGELVLQELLMLGFPVVIRDNKVESEITEGLLGVYKAASLSELSEVCKRISVEWTNIVDDWMIRSEHNRKKINARSPYLKLDRHIQQVAELTFSRRDTISAYSLMDVFKFAYNQNDEFGLKRMIHRWKQSDRFHIERKGSPSQFAKFLPSPEIRNLILQ